MPVLGVLSLLAQIACAVHVVRTGRNYYWIYIVVFVPVVGMAAYFLAEILPDLMNSRTGRGAASGVARALNPGKALRDATRVVAIAPTTENKARLAAEYLAAGETGPAVALYREVLTGVHATDAAGPRAHPLRPGRPGRDADGAGAAARGQSQHQLARRAHDLYPQPRTSGQDRAGAARIRRPHHLLSGPGGALPLCPAAGGERPGRRRAAALRGGLPSIDYGPRHQRREQRPWYDIAKRQLAAGG